MILVPATWRQNPNGAWALEVNGNEVAYVWQGGSGAWFIDSDETQQAYPSAAAAKRAVEKALKARTR